MFINIHLNAFIKKIIDQFKLNKKVKILLIEG